MKSPKSRRRTNTIILLIITAGLLISMLIAFVPGIGALFNGGSQAQGNNGPALVVNGQSLSQLDVARTLQNQVLTSLPEGQAHDDVQLLLLHNLVENAVLQQAAADVKVSGGDVRKAVDAFRQQQGVAKDDQAYRQLLSNAGFTDASFRKYEKEQLKVQKYLQNLSKDVTVTDDEVKSYFDTHREAYMSDAQIKAREIVVKDQTKADALYAQIVAGTDFAQLAKKNSTERADNAGALGAAKGSTEPVAVGHAALPTEVANAAFGLKGPGLTGVISAGGLYYIVKVEDYLPPQQQSMDEVKDKVKADALKAKQDGVTQQKVQALIDGAKVTAPPESQYSYSNPVVAKVGDINLTAAQLDQATYLNPQIQRFLNPQNAAIITSFFKPTILNQMIEQALAFEGAKDLGPSFFGTRADVAQAALSYVSRDAKASDADIQDYYKKNQGGFKVPAQAVAVRVNFTTKESAAAFRQALLQGQSVADASKAHKGTVVNLGTVHPGDQPSEIDNVLFGSKAFTPLPGAGKRGISDTLVISTPVKDGNGAASGGASGGVSGGAVSGGTSGSAASGGSSGASGGAQAKTKDTYVVLLATVTPETVRPLKQVHAQVEQAVLAGKRQDLQSAWLKKLKSKIKVENLLSQVEAKQRAASGGASGGAVSGGTASGGASSGGTVSGGAVSGGISGGISGGVSGGQAASGGAAPSSSGGASSGGQ